MNQERRSCSTILSRRNQVDGLPRVAMIRKQLNKKRRKFQHKVVIHRLDNGRVSQVLLDHLEKNAQKTLSSASIA